MARVLAYTYPSRGHLYPLVPTLVELRQRGHEVRVLTMSGESPGCAASGWTRHPSTPSWRRRVPTTGRRGHRSVRSAARSRSSSPARR